MKKLNTIGIIGLGALGVMYAWHLTGALGKESVVAIADRARLDRYESEGLFFNGEKCDFHYVDIERPEDGPAVDLLMICCKYGQLREVAESVRAWVRPETVIISVLNGVVSEKVLREIYPADQVIDCVARKMSAVKEGPRVTAITPGELVIGPETPSQRENAAAAADILKRAHFPYVLTEDIEKEMWGKLLCNVGCNQAAFVYETTYSGMQAEGEIRRMMIGAMRETAAVAQAMGIDLSEKDVVFWTGVIDALDPTGEPSMRQDGRAHRPSEVALFAGTVSRLGRDTGVPTPINDEWYRIIREREARY